MVQSLALQMLKSDQAKDASIKLLESQLAQLATKQASRQPGQLPSQPDKKPHETVNMINLRSGLSYEGPKMPKENAEFSDSEVEATVHGKSSFDEIVTDSHDNSYKPQVPFTGRLRRTKPEQQFGRFADLLRSLKVNVPLAELLTQNKTPPKFADSGSFSIPCHIGTYLIDNALCDLGASVIILPLSLAKRLGLTKFQCINMTVQMGDHSLSRPLELLEDIPIRIGKLFIPVDFVVLDIPEDSYTLIILGRPFLHTAHAIIDVGAKTLNFQVGGEDLTFTQFSVRRAPMQVMPCNAIPSIDPNEDLSSTSIESYTAVMTPLP
ncbi:uncharacterized protein LOC141627990 [Silene latifolia]|uniref:uncharacterized protein LOC141627990 n=1 Tax=Silene latifolia TaxID=37657 RepID=UPI003D780BA4